MAATNTTNRRDVAPLRPIPTHTLPWPIQFYRSAVGKKWVMGLTGLMLLGFVVFHMLGNFKAYLGPEDINLYGESLRDLGGHLVPRTHLLWLMRIGLAAAFVMHIASAYSLKNLGRRASPKSGLCDRAEEVRSRAGLHCRKLRLQNHAMDRAHRAAVPDLSPC